MMEIYDVVTKLVGPIRPIGCSNADSDRLANLGDMVDLVEKLVSDIGEVARDKNSHMASVKKMGALAYEVLQDIRDSIEKDEESS